MSFKRTFQEVLKEHLDGILFGEIPGVGNPNLFKVQPAVESVPEQISYGMASIKVVPNP